MVFRRKTHDNFRYKCISAIKCTKINVRTHLLVVGKLTYEFVKKIGQGLFMLQSAFRRQMNNTSKVGLGYE